MKERKKNFSKLLKRALIVCLCLVMTLGAAVTIMAATFNGDLDGDGKITAYDAQLLAEYQAGDRDLDPATVIGLTVRDIIDRVLGRIVDEPVVDDNVVEKTVEVKAEEGVVTEEQTFTEENVTVTIPVGVKVTGTELTVTVTKLDASEGGLTPAEGEELLPLDIHVEGVAEDNTTAIIIGVAGMLDAGMNLGNVTVYHVENGEPVAMTQVMDVAELTAHNSFYYDPTTGDITVAMATFSEVSTISETAKGWEGGVDHNWYDPEAEVLSIANADQLWSFSQIVGGMAEGIEQDTFAGKTVKLIADINLGDEDPTKDYSEDNRVFYPIGYYNSTGSYTKVAGGSVTSNVSSFEGTFDGQGHTVGNFYHNTWEMFGDYNSGYSGTPNHYKDGMGLFGYVYNGTVKNLTIENFQCDGEFAPAGCVATYAAGNATFENIAIVDCNPRVYNTGNGGVVGILGNNDEGSDTTVNFTNITVDNSNKISALWGTWDGCCGGIAGMYRGRAKVNLTNCHVGAQIDVFNDVCGNYQYYWYRYSGMLIAAIRTETTDANGYTIPDTSTITAENCTVHFGDWNDYYYCELVENSLASYTHDHQFSRLELIDSLSEIKSGETWTKTGNFAIVDQQTHTGTCYHIRKDAAGNLYQHSHDDYNNDGVEDKQEINGEMIYVEDHRVVYLPFNQLFQGWGWGVKNIPIYNDESLNPFDGVTILDRQYADSIEKFESTGLNEVENGIAVKLGDLFTAKNQTEADIFEVALNISVTDLTEGDGVNTTVELIKTGDSWENYQVIFHGVGAVEVTIQDYYFCAPTQINLTVGAHIHCLCGATTQLGDYCESCKSKAVIYEPTATMPANGATGHYYLTGDIVQTEIAEYSENVSICLNGKTVDLQKKHSRSFNVINGATVNLTDCDGSDATGIITGSTHATIYIHANSRLNMYNGKLTGNKNTLVGGSGIVSLQAAASDAERAAFYMYGGQITGNEMRQRGAVFTQIPNENLPKAGEIHILGGQITGNTSYAERATAPYDQLNAVSGGAGIYSFGPVYVGGDAVIADNTCTMTTSTRNKNILLRTAYENALYSGQLIVEQPLAANAAINYGAQYKDNSDNLQSISVDPSLIAADHVVGVTYEGNTIYYNATEGKFYTKHIHCLCGNETVEGKECASCGSNAVVWTGENRVPEGTTTGYFYLQQDVTTGGDINSSAEMHLCLNGHKVDFAGKGQWNINPNSTVSVSDCMAVEAYSDAYSAGQITGLNGRNDQGKLLAGIKIMTGATFKLYDGMVTGNNNSDGTIWLIASSEANATSKFYMYGGQLSGNTVGRGTVYTQVNTEANGRYAGEIYILGGTITGNHGTDTSNGGGAGIYAFGSVTVGGDAKIIDNTAVQQGVSANMVLRNDYSGKLIISSDVPLTAGAQIDCSTYVADNKANLSIIGEPAQWNAGWIKYNGDYVLYDPDTKVFFQGHTHCLCGKTRTGDCSECGSTAVEWTAWEETDALPTTTGNYYLVNDVTVVYAADKVQKATVIENGQNVAIDLCGHNILNENGDRLTYQRESSTLTVTDCAENAGQISGFGIGNNNAAIILEDNSTFNLYNGKITQNNGGNYGIVYIKETCTFNMYGGEVSSNVSVQRGAIFGYCSNTNVTDSDAPVIRILGGQITGNSSTTTNTNFSGGGVVSLGPVYVGGDAVIADNTANTTNNPNILLVAGNYFGKLILDSAKPLTAQASVDYGVRGVSSFQSSYISFSEAAYELPAGVLTYNGNAVAAANIPVGSGQGEAEAAPAE